MSVSITYMREQIKNASKYRASSKWANKVNNMPDYQVMAIYFRFKREGLI